MKFRKFCIYMTIIVFSLLVGCGNKQQEMVDVATEKQDDNIIATENDDEVIRTNQNEQKKMNNQQILEEIDFSSEKITMIHSNGGGQTSIKLEQGDGEKLKKWFNQAELQEKTFENNTVPTDYNGGDYYAFIDGEETKFLLADLGEGNLYLQVGETWYLVKNETVFPFE